MCKWPESKKLILMHIKTTELRQELVRVCESSPSSMRLTNSFELTVQAALADVEIKICTCIFI